MATVPSFGNLLAVDIGGTKIATALVTARGAIVARRQEATNQEGPEAAIAQIARLLRQTAEAGEVDWQQIAAVGVGIPAVLRHDDHVIWAPNLKHWRDVALREALQSAVDTPVAVEYDGHTAVLGEYWAGAGRGYATVAKVIVGTGIGGGLIVDGRLVRGRNRLTGAAGWFVIDATEGERGTAGIGQWEAMAAGPGIAQRARAALAHYPESVLARAETLDARRVFDAAREGDGLALEVVQETARLIGLGVANVVSLINPEIVILGGSIGCQGDLLLPVVHDVVAAWAQPASAADLPIVSSSLGADAGLLGAAYAALLRLAGEQKEVTSLS